MKAVYIGPRPRRKPAKKSRRAKDVIVYSAVAKACRGQRGRIVRMSLTPTLDNAVEAAPSRLPGLVLWGRIGSVYDEHPMMVSCRSGSTVFLFEGIFYVAGDDVRDPVAWLLGVS